MDVASSKLDKVLSVKCPLHGPQTIEIVRVNASAANHMACTQCFYDSSNLSSTAVKIEKIF